MRIDTILMRTTSPSQVVPPPRSVTTPGCRSVATHHVGSTCCGSGRYGRGLRMGRTALSAVRGARDDQGEEKEGVSDPAARRFTDPGVAHALMSASSTGVRARDRQRVTDQASAWPFRRLQMSHVSGPASSSPMGHPEGFSASLIWPW